MQYAQSKIIVASRPDTRLTDAGLERFDSVQLCGLDHADSVKLVCARLGDGQELDRLLLAFSHSKAAGLGLQPAVVHVAPRNLCGNRVYFHFDEFELQETIFEMSMDSRELNADLSGQISQACQSATNPDQASDFATCCDHLCGLTTRIRVGSNTRLPSRPNGSRYATEYARAEVSKARRSPISPPRLRCPSASARRPRRRFRRTRLGHVDRELKDQHVELWRVGPAGAKLVDFCPAPA